MGWSVHTPPCGKSCWLCCVFLIVFLLMCGCQCSVFLPGCSFHGYVCVHISLLKEPLALLCVPNCVLVDVWLSVTRVFCVSSWWFHGLACAHISLWKELPAWYCVLVLLLLCGCQCSVFLPGGPKGWSVHTSTCGKSWLLCFNCVPNCVLAVMRLSVFCVSSWWFHELVCAHISLWKS